MKIIFNYDYSNQFLEEKFVEDGESQRRNTDSEMLADSMSTQNIRRMAEKHAEKVHFVPIRYRIIGGILPVE